jgi:hypothetical protein
MGVTLNQYLGQRVKQHRAVSSRNWRQDDVALKARQLGFDWHRDTVAAIENDLRKLTIGEFIYIPLILDMSDHADLFPVGDDTVIEMAPGLEVKAYSLRSFFSAHRAPRPTRVPSLTKVTKRIAERQSAEIKAAMKLNIGVKELEAICKQKYGRSFSRERDSRITNKDELSARSLQAKRGHAARQLVDELKQELQTK